MSLTTTTNRALFTSVWRRRDLDAALRAVGVDPNATRIRRLRFTQSSPEGRAIVAAVATEHRVEPGVLLARCRIPELVAARYEAMARMRALGWSTPRIGREMGCGHTAVLYGLGRLAAKRPSAKVALAGAAAGGREAAA